MPITIGSNISSLRAQRELSKGTDALSKVYERLSSGQRINRASDDAAGLAISSALNADARIFNIAQRNISDGISLLSIADGALGELSSLVTRIYELGEQSANGVYSNTQRVALDSEAQALANEYDRIIETTKFNGLSLLKGNNISFDFQVGSNGSSASRIVASLGTINGTHVGVGTFEDGTTYTSSGRITGVTAGDFNNDGYNDLVSGSDSGGTNLLFLNNGDGTFKQSLVISSSGQTFAADLNGDNNLDLVLSGNGRVLLGNGNGTFKAGVNYASQAVYQVADVNADQILDLISTNSTNSLSVHFGNGNGTFQAEVAYAQPSTFIGSIATYDFDNNGAADIVTRDNGLVRVLLNNGNGTFLAPVAYTASGLPVKVSISDFNGDGLADILSNGDATTTLLLGNGNGTFKVQTAVGVGGRSSIADLNGDGNNDFVVTASGLAYTYLGNGNGTFLARTTATVSTSAHNNTLADLNGDGVLDLAVATYNDGLISVLFQDAVNQATLGDFNLLTAASSRQTLETMKNALAGLASTRGVIGAAQSRLEIASANAAVTRENSLAAESRIMDADIAFESSAMLRLQILQRATSAVLAQANQQPALALKLLDI